MSQERKTVLVIGAGINGVAIARELLLNRVSVCLVDRWDIASGTTAYSSRLIHGGLRYLEYGDFELVRESLAERERLLRLSPQFVKPLHLFIPLERRVSGFLPAAGKFLGWKSVSARRPVPRGMWLVDMGLRMYDRLARKSSLPRHQVFRVNDPAAPPVNVQRYRWLCSYYDAQIEFPERFVLAMLEDARQLALENDAQLDVFTYHRMTKSGPLVTIRPASGGDSQAPPSTTDAQPVTLEPDVIINATGAWVDQALTQLAVSSPSLIGGTKGSHFLTRNPQLREALAGHGVYAEASDGRPVFLLAFGHYSLVGTTDLECNSSPETVIASEEELEYLRRAALEVFPQVQLTREDIELHYCGVRPLPAASASTTAAITRRHLLHESEDPDLPVISVIGGKLTTCRSLAEDVARLLLDRWGIADRVDSRTRVIPGGENYPASPERLAIECDRIAEQLQMTPQQVAAVWRLCGTRTAEMLAATEAESADENGARNLPDSDLPERFVRRVIREQWCCRLVDLVERRLMLLFSPDLSVACLNRLAELMVEAGVLDPDAVPSEVSHCLERLAAHFGRVLKGGQTS